MQFAPGVYAALYARRVRGGAILAGMLSGGALTVSMILWPWLQPIPLHAGLWGLALNLLIVGAVTLRRPATPTEEDELFLATAEGSAER